MRSATAATGPIPGRTPTSVPARQPTNARRRCSGRSATEKPYIRRSSASIALQPEDAGGQLDVEKFHERPVDAEAAKEGGKCDQSQVPHPERRQNQDLKSEN